MTRRVVVRHLMLGGCLIVAACQPPPAQRASGALEAERALHAGALKADPTGRLEIFTTSLMTDGRFLMVRGQIRNPMPEPIDGARVMFKVYLSDAEAPLDVIQEQKDFHLAPGETTALRLDVQTMYAGGETSFFRVEAYAARVGGRDIPPPPGWRDDE